MKKKKFLMELGKLILVFLLFYFSSFLQLIPIKLFGITDINSQVTVLLSMFSNIILLIILLLIYRKEFKLEWKRFKKNKLFNLDVGFRYWFIGLVIMIVTNGILANILGLGQADNEQAVQKMISSLPWLMVINAGLIAPFIEETIFRKAFKNAFNNKWIFIMASGIVFGLLHVINSTTILGYLYIIPYSTLGISFAAMYSKTDTFFTSYFAHAFHNTLLVLLSII